jgi:hypothetical protein
MSSPTNRFLKNKTCGLKQVEKPHGKLANFEHSTELMKSFKFNLLQLLNKLQGQESVKIIPEALRKTFGFGRNTLRTVDINFQFADS